MPEETTMTDKLLSRLIPPLPAHLSALPVSRTHVMPRDADEGMPAVAQAKREYWRKWREKNPRVDNT